MITLKCARRQLIKNKDTTLITIIGIILSVAMMTALLLFCTAFLGLIRQSREEVDGSWHFMLTQASPEETEQLSKREDIENFATLDILGMADEYAENGRYFSVLYQLPENQPFVGLHLEKGRLPENAHELIIPQNYYSADLNRVKVGDKLTLPWGKLEFDGKELPFLQLNSNALDLEKISFKEEFTQEYTIVGIYARGGGDSVAPNLQAFYTKDSRVPLGQNLLIRSKEFNVGILKDWQKSQYGERLLANASLVDLLPGASGLTFNLLVKSFALVFIVIIAAAGIGMITNAFAISLSRRTRSLSILSSIGMTRCQKWQMVLWEGLILLLLALPLGVFAGHLGISVVCRVLEAPMQDLLHTRGLLRPVWDAGLLIRIIVLSTLTIVFSSIIPAERSSRFSPLAGLNEESEHHLNVNTLRVSPFWAKRLGFAAEMGIKNMKRSRRRTRAISISLVLSLVLFNSVLYLSHMMRKTVDLKADQGLADIVIRSTSSADQHFLQSIRELSEVKDSFLIQSGYFELKQTNEMHASLFSNNKTPCTLLALPPQDLERYLKLIGMNSLNDEEVILINVLNTRSKQDGKFNEIQTLADTLPESLELISPENGRIFKLKPTALTSKSVPDFADWSGHPVIVAPQKIVNEHPEQKWSSQMNLYAREGELESLREALYHLLEEAPEEYYLIDKAYENGYLRNVILITEVLFTGFVSLITLISLFNILNTVLNSFSMREKEFAILRSAGMEKRQFHRMIFSEGLIYSSKIFLWGLICSCLLASGIKTYLSRSVEISADLPWWLFCTSGAVVAVLVQLLMQWAFRRTGHKVLVENLKS